MTYKEKIVPTQKRVGIFVLMFVFIPQGFYRYEQKLNVFIRKIGDVNGLCALYAK